MHVFLVSFSIFTTSGKFQASAKECQSETEPEAVLAQNPSKLFI